ncbi:MAG: hypothetical protein K6F39_06105 [Lachnospiraceae bacterium]|nr:hypothetical protein [Lachnospiraceae bacterium]
MKKEYKKVLAVAISTSMVMAPCAVYAATVSADSENTAYASTSDTENAVYVSGEVTLTNPTITKTGDGTGETADFYGLNAAVLVPDGSTLTLTNGTVTTEGAYANGVQAYAGTVNISGTEIVTKSNNSGGIMTTGGGVMNASDLTVTTEGGSSAAIRSDRGGGTVTVDGGTYETSGTGSPAIYSTADITVEDATLTSNASEAIVVEGANSVTLNDCTVDGTNSELNGQSTTYKNVFLYQSMSGDADVGTAEFTMNGGSMTCNKGDMFYITNTTCTIDLDNASLTNSSDGDLLRAEAAAWGTSGSNGGDVTLTAANQTLEGDMIVDDISELDLVLKDNSTYEGAINTDGAAGTVNVTLEEGTTWNLTGDSYINELTDNGGEINTNGYTLSENNKGSGSSDSGSDTGSGNGAPSMPGQPGNGGQTPPDIPSGDQNSGTPSDSTVSSNETTEEYNGYTITFPSTVSFNGKKQKINDEIIVSANGTQYAVKGVKYKNNKNAGTASFQITKLDSTDKTVKKALKGQWFSYDIEQLEVTSENSEVKTNSKGSVKSIKVTNGSRTIKVPKKMRTIDTSSQTITFSGNFSGTISY